MAKAKLATVDVEQDLALAKCYIKERPAPTVPNSEFFQHFFIQTSYAASAQSGRV